MVLGEGGGGRGGMLRPTLEWQSCFWKIGNLVLRQVSKNTGGLGMGGESLIDHPSPIVRWWYKSPQWENSHIPSKVHDSQCILQVFVTWISLCILQSVCYMVLPMDLRSICYKILPNAFCKVFATWFSQCILQSVLLHGSPNGFCRVFATWFSRCILQSVCYMILPM
jgi:hypothetical protein